MVIATLRVRAVQKADVFRATELALGCAETSVPRVAVEHVTKHAKEQQVKTNTS